MPSGIKQNFHENYEKSPKFPKKTLNFRRALRGDGGGFTKIFDASSRTLVYREFLYAMSWLCRTWHRYCDDMSW